MVLIMTITIKEAMKKINLLQQQLLSLHQYEDLNNSISYLSEDDKETSDYNFNEVSQQMDELQNKILYLRRAINKANQNTMIGIHDYSISDALVRIAQLNQKAERLQALSIAKQKERIVSYTGETETIERLYDVKHVTQLHLETVEHIYQLQTAIDKANILTEI